MTNPVGAAEAAVARFLTREHRLLIGGEWVKPVSGETIAVHDPATGRQIATIAAGGAEDVDLAVKAARRAFRAPEWTNLQPAQRGRLLFILADLIEANAAEIALLESMDGGNPLGGIQHVDLALAIGNLRNIAGWADKVWGDVPMTGAAAPGMGYVVREPVGVVGAITPWNAPFLMAVHKIAPALAMGCTVVHKPAELAPLTALRLAELVLEAGFPAGVLNIVTGYGHVAGQAIADHPGVNKISFTGSTRVGRSILQSSGGNMKRVTLELGGKSPIIVLADADLDKAAAAIAQESTFKTGQYCAAGTRLLVEASAHDALNEKIAAAMRAIRVGGGTETGTQMGPIISQQQLERVLSYVEQARADGAEVITGGNRIERDGWFVEPTLLAGVTPEMSVFRDEIFGPVLTVSVVEDGAKLDDIAEWANDSSYGLAARIWTRDIGKAHGLARRIEAGSISVNGGGYGGRMPFGGFKQSGLGREGGYEGMLAFTETKSISIAF